MPAVRRKRLRAGATKRHYATTLEDLLLVGRLTVGTVLHGRHHGVHYEVVVRGNGLVESDGEIFNSLSQAARLLTGQKAVNGWAFWHTGAGTPVGDLRDGV